MKRKAIPLLWMILSAVLLTGALAPRLAEERKSGEVPHGCTVFTVSQGERVFFGGNDDYVLADTTYWVDPGGLTGYGAIWVGDPDNVQQGVNEKGLAYDSNGLPRVEVNPHRERDPVPEHYPWYAIQILRECATVQEVIDWISTHQRFDYMHDQLHFADAAGDAVIVSAGADGEIVFTRKPPGDGYLVSTNFNVANPSNGYGYPCQRYQTANRMLQPLADGRKELTAESATRVLDAVHQQSAAGWTLASLLADLPNGVVYLYTFYQFDRPVVLRVADEIANPRPRGSLNALFPEDVQLESARRHRRIQAKSARCQYVGLTWLGAVFASLITLSLLVPGKRGSLGAWTVLVLLLGPLGLAVRLACRRRRRAAGWLDALLEATGDATPSAAAFVGMLVALIPASIGGFGVAINLAFLLAVPLLVALLLLPGLLLSLSAGEKTGRALRHRLPHAWIAANLGTGGIHALAGPLIRLSLSACAAVPLSPWAVVTWWAAAVAGALAGIVLLIGYERWALSRGYRAWSALAVESGAPSSLPWRALWWWLPISYLVLAGGVLLGQVLIGLFGL